MGRVASILQLVVAAAIAAAHAASAAPRECRARADAPYLPIFHVVGNITDSASGRGFQTESINDVSGVVQYMGIYHIFHQCCQNHWDHLASADLVHWTRLPPPIRPSADPHEWYDSKGSYDGSVSMLPAEQGGPVILFAPFQAPLTVLHSIAPFTTHFLFHVVVSVPTVMCVIPYTYRKIVWTAR